MERQVKKSLPQEALPLTLRPYTEEEYHTFFRDYQTDPTLEHPFVYSHEMVSRSYHYNYDGFRPDYAQYGIFLGPRVIGCFQLKRMDPQRGRCEFGLILQNASVRGRGYGTQAVRLGLREARDRFHMRTVLGDTMSLNLSMRTVFEKLGFVLVERAPHAFDTPSGPADRLVYQLDDLSAL